MKKIQIKANKIYRKDVDVSNLIEPEVAPTLVEAEPVVEPTLVEAEPVVEPVSTTKKKTSKSSKSQASKDFFETLSDELKLSVMLGEKSLDELKSVGNGVDNSNDSKSYTQELAEKKDKLDNVISFVSKLENNKISSVELDHELLDIQARLDELDEQIKKVKKFRLASDESKSKALDVLNSKKDTLDKKLLFLNNVKNKEISDEKFKEILNDLLRQRDYLEAEIKSVKREEVKPAKEKKEKKKFKLSGTAKGRLKKAIGVLVAGGVVVGGIAIGSALINSHKDDTKDPINNGDTPTPGETNSNKPSDNNQGGTNSNESGDVNTPSDENLEKIETATEAVYNSWMNAGSIYTKDQVRELIKLVRGYESNISYDTADDMLISLINSATVPAMQNAVIGDKYYPVQSVDISILLDNCPVAITDMQDYFNGLVNNPDVDSLTFYSTCTFEDIARLLGENETVEGFNLNTASANENWIWARLANACMTLAGNLGPDFKVIVNGKVYSQIDLNNCNIYESIISKSFEELGYSSKVLSLN